MAKKQTTAQAKTTAHTKRRADRIANRSMPQFHPHMMPQSGVVVLPDADGRLVRIDADNGTVRRLRWEQ